MRDWRPDVEMPPHVAVLPRTAAGVPISFTVAYSSEKNFVLRPDPLLVPLGIPVTTPAIFSGGRRGLGEPIINVSDVSRQRACNVQGRCQVCGRRVPAGARYIADLRNRGQTIRLSGVERPLLVDSWTCLSCLRYSLRVCPGLAKRQPDIFRCTKWELVATFERPDSVPEHELPRGAVGWVKVAPIVYERVFFMDAQEAVHG